jgi:NADH dehydrogenase (ubiquinone) Fe-S protein 3
LHGSENILLYRKSAQENYGFSMEFSTLCIQYYSCICVQSNVEEIIPICSIVSIFPLASWWEREVWDMVSVHFSNHPDLRSILTYYGFESHPLQKDFLLSGYVDVHYDDSEKRVVSEPIEMIQEFHYFDFASPWEQMSHSDKSNKK